MTLFPELRAELVEAMERGPRRRRPARRLLVPAVALAVAVAVAVALIAWPRADFGPPAPVARETLADLPEPIQQALAPGLGVRPRSPPSRVPLTHGRGPRR